MKLGIEAINFTAYDQAREAITSGQQSVKYDEGTGEVLPKAVIKMIKHDLGCLPYMYRETPIK